MLPPQPQLGMHAQRLPTCDLAQQRRVARRAVAACRRQPAQLPQLQAAAEACQMAHAGQQRRCCIPRLQLQSLQLLSKHLRACRASRASPCCGALPGQRHAAGEPLRRPGRARAAAATKRMGAAASPSCHDDFRQRRAQPLLLLRGEPGVAAIPAGMGVAHGWRPLARQARAGAAGSRQEVAGCRAGWQAGRRARAPLRSPTWPAAGRAGGSGQRGTAAPHLPGPAAARRRRRHWRPGLPPGRRVRPGGRRLPLLTQHMRTTAGAPREPARPSGLAGVGREGVRWAGGGARECMAAQEECWQAVSCGSLAQGARALTAAVDPAYLRDRPPAPQPLPRPAAAARRGAARRQATGSAGRRQAPAALPR